MFKKSLNGILIFTFFVSSLAPVPKASADALALPMPGTMVSLSPAYNPVMIKGLTVHKDNPFLFDFIVDTGDGLDLRGHVSPPRRGYVSPLFKQEADKLIKYFLASLTIPEGSLGQLIPV